MNLEDVIDPEYGLQQDDWSESRPRFGDEGQLEVVGWSGRSSSNKIYILKCSSCSNDIELFGEGIFKSLRSNLVRGSLPCGCSSKREWSKDQFSILCSRKARKVGYKFLGFDGDWRGNKTKIRMLCEKHGEWSSSIINSFLDTGCGCPRCKFEESSLRNTKPDEIMIASFFASGAFHPDTKFWRSARVNTKGYKPYWCMSCPECDEQSVAFSGDLQIGHRPCACSKSRQQHAYINWVVDNNNQAVAIKLGIANNSGRRVTQQNNKSVYKILSHSTYTFPDVSSCKAAERECKQTLECGVLSKEEMPDGYTETTSVLNLGRIKRIYEKHGGVLNEKENR